MSGRRTPLWAMLLVAACTLLIALAHTLMKQGLSRGVSFPDVLANYPLLAGIAVAVVSGLLLAFSFKHGDLSVLHPIIALGFLWAALASVFILGESLPPLHIAGIASIIVGVGLIGHSSRRPA